ncbi:hypothetical protein [Rhodococcus sovatensis]|uniref:Uncharacterized protein n=1 Tax=Rhodococcus sovatensis TaxID=1805840 RepID=A0ABZ2PI32_9NOCA
MIATLDFETADERAAALVTREMADAGTDLKNFAAGITMYTTDNIAFG